MSAGRRRHAEDRGQFAMRAEQRLDAFSQLGVRRTFPFENLRLNSRVRSFDHRFENKLNAFLINCHRMAPEQFTSLLSPDVTACKPQTHVGETGAIAERLPAQKNRPLQARRLKRLWREDRGSSTFSGSTYEQSELAFASESTPSA